MKQAESAPRVASGRLSLLGILFAALVAVGCSGGDATDPARPTTAPPPPGIAGAETPSGEPIIVSLPADVQKLDPPQPTDGNSMVVVAHLYDRLVEFHDTEVKVVPALAESWAISDDGLRYTFNLRDDATFSNGDPVLASDVKFTFERIVDPEHPQHFTIPWSSDILGDWFDHIETPDDHTAVFVLNRPYVPLLSNLAIPPASIVSERHLKEVGRDRSVTEPMGSGPYELDEWQQGQFVVLRARDTHWRGRGKTDRLIFRTQKDQNQTMSALRRGDSHLAIVLSPAVIDRSNLGQAVVHDFPIFSLGYAIFNVQKPALASRELRLAMNYAIDRESICTTLLEGMGIPSGTITPPGMLGSRENPDTAFTYDPDRARELIAQSGYDGSPIELMCFSAARPYNPIGVRLAQRLQEDLRGVGINIELAQMEFGAVIETVEQRTRHEMAMLGWSSDNGDPDNFIYYLFGAPNNRANYDNPEARALMQEAQGETDADRRAALYAQAEDLLLADPPALIINHAKGVKGASNRLRGWAPHPIRSDYLWSAYLVE